MVNDARPAEVVLGGAAVGGGVVGWCGGDWGVDLGARGGLGRGASFGGAISAWY